MKTLRLLLGTFLALVGLSGCLQVEKIVKLKPDGSGTVEETVLMSKSALDQMKQMASGFGGGASGGKGFNLLDEDKLKEAAGQMGEGVTFVSATPISAAQSEGFKVIYAFSDISKLKIDQNPSSAMPSTGGMKMSSGKQKKEPVAFRFTKGTPAELTVVMPQPDLKAKKEKAEGMDAMAAQMMQQMLKDMKIALALEVAGTITETNAEFRDGSRVTFMVVDMNKLLADPEKFKAMTKAQPQTLQEAKGILKGLDGVKVETAPEVKIKFK